MGWRPKSEDLDRYRELYDAASSAILRAERALAGELAWSERQLADLLPTIGPAETGDDLASLKMGFANRQEFSRELSYLKRIADSEQTKRGQKYQRMTYEAAGSLTSGRVDPATGQYVTQFMERERSLTKRRKNDAALKLIRDAGIEMERVPVLDENGKQATDEWRHKLYTYIPATPDNERKLRDLEERNPGAQYIPDEAASNMRVMKYGDLKTIGEVRTARYTPRQIYDSIRSDTVADMRNRMYWANYDVIAQTALGPELGGEISGYIDRIQRLPYAERYRLYQLIEGEDAAYAQLDYVYDDTMGSTSVKLARMMGFWRQTVVPKIDAYEGRGEDDLTKTSDLMPVTPADPAYMHLRNAEAFAVEPEAEPSVKDAYKLNAKVRPYHLQEAGRTLAKWATGITMQEIKDIFYSIGTFGGA
jgi:hypothetical protein